jgi:hypothetical protein
MIVVDLANFSLFGQYMSYQEFAWKELKSNLNFNTAFSKHSIEPYLRNNFINCCGYVYKLYYPKLLFIHATKNSAY